MPDNHALDDVQTQSRKLCAESSALREASRRIRQQSFSARVEASLLHNESPHDLVPLNLVVARIWQSVYDGKTASVPSREGAHLDGLAYTVTALCPIYAYETDSNKSRRVTPNEISSCLFRYGAKEIHFTDGRPPIRNLAVAAKVAPLLIEDLKTIISNPDCRLE